MQPYKQKCNTCLLENHPGSSQCPYCLGWYLTHTTSPAGQRADQEVRQHHAQRRCLRTEASPPPLERVCVLAGSGSIGFGYRVPAPGAWLERVRRNNRLDGSIA